MKRPILPYESSLVSKAKELRKQMTFSEVVLWKQLSRKQMMGYDFDRQRPILKYIVDFYCKDLMLAIEVDGITHHDDSRYAFNRQVEMEALGVTFLRFDALLVVNNTQEILTTISNWIQHFEEDNGVLPHIKAWREK